MNTVKLPELPRPGVSRVRRDGCVDAFYTAAQMGAYARAAVEASQSSAAVTEAMVRRALSADCNGSMVIEYLICSDQASAEEIITAALSQGGKP